MKSRFFKTRPRFLKLTFGLAIFLAASVGGWITSYWRPHDFWFGKIETSWCVVVLNRGQVIFSYSADGLPALVSPNEAEMPYLRGNRADFLQKLSRALRRRDKHSDEEITSYYMALNTCRDKFEIRSLKERTAWLARFGFFLRATTTPATMITICIPFWAMTTCSITALVFVVWKNRDRLLEYRLRNLLCTRCAYNLTGNCGGICPECGTAIPPEQMERIKQAAVSGGHEAR